MPTVKSWVMDLSPGLFWDTDQTLVDEKEHLKSVFERVVERGYWSDWVLFLAHVSRSQMLELFPRLRLPPREIAFLKAFLEIQDPQS